MSFGFNNVPTVFMDLMNRFFKPSLDKFWYRVHYCIIIYSLNEENHASNLKLVLHTLKYKKLYVMFLNVSFGLRCWDCWTTQSLQMELKLIPNR